jgi:hypothetical protein
LRARRTGDYHARMREYHYSVDRDGRIFHDGTEIVDRAVLQLFLRAMRRMPDGRYLAPCQGEHNWFDAPDTPFVVQRIGPRASDGASSVELSFAGDYREPLDPSTLESRDGHLYCRIKLGSIPARFGRIAVQQLAAHLTEAAGELVAVLDGARYPIRQL